MLNIQRLHILHGSKGRQTMRLFSLIITNLFCLDAAP